MIMVFNPAKLALPPDKRREIKPKVEKKIKFRVGRKFLKGPVDLEWLSVATSLPGRSLHVGLALWYMKGVTGFSTVKLTSNTRELFHIDRHAFYRALDWLKEAGLIEIKGKRGTATMITIKDISSEMV